MENELIIHKSTIKGLPGYEIAYNISQNEINIDYVIPIIGKAKGKKIRGYKLPSGCRKFSFRYGDKRIYLTEGRIACCIRYNLRIDEMAEIKIQLDRNGLPLDQIEAKQKRDKQIMFTSYDEILDLTHLIGDVRAGKVLDFYTRANSLKRRVSRSLCTHGIPVAKTDFLYEEAVEKVRQQMINLNKRAIPPLYIWIRNNVIKLAKERAPLIKSISSQLQND